MAKFNIFKNFSFNNLFNPRRQGNAWFYSLNDGNSVFDNSNNLNNFLQIPELNSIINIRARAMASWKVSIVSKTTGKEQLANQSLVRILKTPNWFQGQSEFWRQSNLYRDIYGNEYIYFLTPFGMPNSYKGMFALDPSKIEIKYTGHKAFFTEANGDGIAYIYRMDDGTTFPLEKADLIHLNDNRVNTSKFLYGTSKMESLSAPLNNIREAYKKRNIALRMPIGIMSNNSDDAIGQAVPMDPDEKKDVKNRIMTRGAYPIITDLNVKYNAMNINSNTMGLFEEVLEDTAKLCDAYGVPYEILASQKGVTFANLKEAKKQFYEETIIPDAKEKIDALNLMLDTENKSWNLVADFSHLPVFSEDVKNRTESLARLVTALNDALSVGAITMDQYKKELQKFNI